eukprot:CAMPEP_0172676124 /NCGR_PEP_ID=MMETSP1074-20121228/13743_1 /TAXON_ID=2916 /ORGANISM="Ceratium fusus, Strain PA161109" /LENGTH=135 /DNA_ID=CAMNT_0013493707 /DNA_START=289 /DNA_END=698 /DNA_ORIENTATION=-
MGSVMMDICAPVSTISSTICPAISQATCIMWSSSSLLSDSLGDDCGNDCESAASADIVRDQSAPQGKESQKPGNSFQVDASTMQDPTWVQVLSTRPGCTDGALPHRGCVTDSTNATNGGKWVWGPSGGPPFRVHP